MSSSTPTQANGSLPAPAEEEPTVGKLVADASRDLSTLIHSEIELAKSELKISVKAGGLAIGLFAGAAFLGVMALIMLSVAIAYLISMTGLHLAWCFLIVFAFYLLVAGVLAFVGIKKVKQVGPPEKAIEQAQETKQIFSRG